MPFINSNRLQNNYFPTEKSNKLNHNQSVISLFAIKGSNEINKNLTVHDLKEMLAQPEKKDNAFHILSSCVEEVIANKRFFSCFSNISSLPVKMVEFLNLLTLEQVLSVHQLLSENAKSSFYKSQIIQSTINKTIESLDKVNIDINELTDQLNTAINNFDINVLGADNIKKVFNFFTKFCIESDEIDDHLLIALTLTLILDKFSDIISKDDAKKLYDLSSKGEPTRVENEYYGDHLKSPSLKVILKEKFKF